MRIAFITHQFFPASYTGVERLTLNLATQLRRMGHESVVITAAEHSSGDELEYSVSGTRVRPIRAGRVDLGQPWLHDPAAGARLGRVLDEEETELVHVMHPTRLPQVFDQADRRGLATVAHIADFAYLCPRVILVRTDGTLCGGPDGGRACVAHCGVGAGVERFGWARDVLERADAVVSPCRSTIEFFDAEGFDTQGWHHVPWGVDYAVHPKRFPSPERDGLVVGFIGTLIPHKGAHVLVEAVRRLEGRAIEVVLYGRSLDADAYERELRKLAGGDRRIRFAGTYEHREFAQVLAPLDLVAVPSLWQENLPTAAMNAVAAGVPIVASDFSGITELIDDYDCGFAFKPGSVDALAELLENLLHDRAALSDMRQHMRFPPSLEEEAWRIEQIYEGINSRRRDALERNGSTRKDARTQAESLALN